MVLQRSNNVCISSRKQSTWNSFHAFIAGIIIISLAARVGIDDDYDTKVEKSIESTITANYNDVLNYHNDEDNKTFVSGGSKYTFDYDEKTKTLIVFTGSDVDAVFVNGAKQKGEK